MEILILNDKSIILELKSKVIKAVSWSAGSRILIQSFQWVITIIVMRLLMPSDYGLLAMATIFIGFIAMVSELGVGTAIIQKQDITQVELRKTFSFIIFLGLVIFLVLFFTAPFIAAFFDENKLTAIIRVLAFQFIILSFSTIPQSLLQKEMNFKKNQ